MTEDQFNTAVGVLTLKLKRCNEERHRLDVIRERSSPRYDIISANRFGYEYCLRDMFGEEEADRVINEAEKRAAL